MTLEDEYFDWLEKNCKCEDDACECMDFEDWWEDREYDRYADITEEDLYA
jgi:hypothetical protein